MKTMPRLLLLVILIILVSFIFTGCWNYRELDEITIATALAIDKDKEREGYVITVETVAPKGGEELQMVPDVISVYSKTILNGIRDMITESGKKLYWSHAKIIVISEEIAREGIVPVLDFAPRDAEMRSDIWILISTDKTASAILEGNDKMHSAMAFHIDDLLKNQNSVPKFHAIELMDFLKDLSSEGISATIPTTHMIKKKDEVLPIVRGTAVFKKDRMVGWIDGLETRSMLIVKNKLKNGMIVIPKVADTNTDVTLEVFNNKTKVKPVIKDGKLSIKVDVVMTVGIACITGYDEFISKDGRNKLKNHAQAAIKKEIIDVITKVQKQYKSDIFGFGNTIYRHMPSVWRTVREDWENVFSELPVDVNVEVIIKSSAVTSKLIKIGD